MGPFKFVTEKLLEETYKTFPWLWVQPMFFGGVLCLNMDVISMSIKILDFVWLWNLSMIICWFLGWRFQPGQRYESRSYLRLGFLAMVVVPCHGCKIFLSTLWFLGIFNQIIWLYDHTMWPHLLFSSSQLTNR